MDAEIGQFVLRTARDFWAVTAEMSPYLLFGFFVAGVLFVFLSPTFVRKHLGGKGISPLFKASLFGVPLPLCSCGVIPVSMSLHKSGAGKGATISFLLSTPQTGIDSILVTWSLLGWLLAVTKPIVAFITGLIGGICVDLFDREEQSDRTPPVNQIPKDEPPAEKRRPHRIATLFKYGFVTLPRDIGRSMLVGLFIAALISALVPEGYFAEKLGTGILSKIVMMILGIPIYVCATASVPVAAALIAKGVTPGAALVFLMTGPATNAATFVTIWKTLSFRTAVIYLLTVAGCALIAGTGLDLLITTLDISGVHKPHWMMPQWIQYGSAVVLLAILGWAAFRPLLKMVKSPDPCDNTQ